MTWKLEHWLRDVFPGKERIYGEYRTLPGRELIVVSVAVLDLALATLLELRLLDFEDESHSFLGADGDGRAPSASFGARIQLALLVGIITKADASVLRALKKLRNSVSHRVRFDLRTEPYLGQLRNLARVWRSQAEALSKSNHLFGTTDQIAEVERQLESVQEAGEGLVLAVFTVYHAYFHLLATRVRRIEPFV